MDEREYRRNVRLYEEMAAERVRMREEKARRVAVIGPLLDSFYGNGCLLCDERERCCLDAHHVDASEKSFGIHRARDGRHSIEAVVSELRNASACAATVMRRYTQAL